MGGLQENLFLTDQHQHGCAALFGSCEALFQIEHDPYWNLPAAPSGIGGLGLHGPGYRSKHPHMPWYRLFGANTRIRHWRVNHRGSMGLTNGFRWRYPDLLKSISRYFEFLCGFSRISLNTVGRLFNQAVGFVTGLAAG
jgi:hypothetical protein